jgi:hypothetical protein
MVLACDYSLRERVRVLSADQRLVRCGALGDYLSGGIGYGNEVERKIALRVSEKVLQAAPRSSRIAVFTICADERAVCDCICETGGSRAHFNEPLFVKRGRSASISLKLLGSHIARARGNPGQHYGGN